MKRIGCAIGVVLAPALLVVGGPTAHAAACTITGTPGDDVLTGTAGPDVICGLGGNDVLRGRAGDDVLDGGDGADVLVGRDGHDELIGGAGHDGLVPGRGDDVVDGGSERDNVSYRDLADGVTVDLAAGTATGPSAGADVLTSVAGMIGTTGDDTLLGTDGRDYVAALAGDDLLRPADNPRDLIEGGSGRDRLDFSGRDQGVGVWLERETFLAGPNFNKPSGRILGIEDVVGTDDVDVLLGDPGPNALTGGGGPDNLIGFGGDDVITAGPGSDYIMPGEGNDAMDGGPGTDRLVFPLWDVPIDLDLDQGTVTRGGRTAPIAGVDVVEGSALADRLHGGLGETVVTINGRGGKDDVSTVDGYPGDYIFSDYYLSGTTCAGDPGDTLYCDLDNPRGRSASGAGCTIRGTTRNDVLVGTPRSDVICGRGGNDVLRGLGSSDVLRGGGGDDVLRSDRGHDRAVGGAGDDVIDGGVGNDQIFPGLGDDEVRGGLGKRDTVDFSDLASGAVVVDLAANTSTGAGADLVAGVEGAIAPIGLTVSLATPVRTSSTAWAATT